MEYLLPKLKERKEIESASEKQASAYIALLKIL